LKKTRTRRAAWQLIEIMLEISAGEIGFHLNWFTEPG
jgi:hypothetical protein